MIVRIDTRLFRSILARRFFTLFVVSALVPTAILAIVAYPYVSDQLFEQSSERLWRTAKTESLSVHERLLFLESQLDSVASMMTDVDWKHGIEASASARMNEMFDGLALAADDGSVTVFYGEPPPYPQPQPSQLEHLRQGKTALVTNGPGGAEDRALRMWRLLKPDSPSSRVIVGTISENYLWGLETGNLVPPDTEICIYDDNRRLLFGSFAGCVDFESEVAALAGSGVRGEIGFVWGGEEYRASYRNLFLLPIFMVRDWTFVLVESEDRILQPMRNFRNIFPPVVLTSLWVVLLVSIYSIRRSLVPLDRLTEGTQRIAKKDFSTKVEVDSGDEFEDLADAFNGMSQRLRRQFRALATNAGIHRAILSSLDTPTIVETAVIGALEAVDADMVGIALRTGESLDEMMMLLAAKGSPETVHTATAELSAWDLDALTQNPESVTLSDDFGASGLLAALPAAEDLTVTALPVLLEERLEAILCLGRADGREFTDEECSQARQLADQVAVALSNSRLIDELKALTWGTLEAFARAIDAKSPWTAGHSERVTTMSMRIAKQMGRSDNELEVLHRGALLHDVGKLGISVKLLDKPGRLDDEELQHVMTHPIVGGRILQPITAFADILPIVEQHHEKFNGTGYPKKLAGEEIDINARILAVADTYDAMTSDRPYRRGFDHEKAVRLILEESGTQFDPKVLKAFMVATGEDPARVSEWTDEDMLREAGGGQG
jgi:HD-GYP domain-containing protein (c-di-GMP phosphodiesterase class II)/HAMP domain-containing protein